jgi:uncharacterized protein (DUF488 family)
METIYTIGFTKRKAKDFFDILILNEIKKIFDIRLNNRSQLAGFSKGDDLEYFLEKIAGIKYEHFLSAAPSEKILKAYQNKDITWKEYEDEYLKMIENRQILNIFKSCDKNGICFLCSEFDAKNCHRRLFAEYLQKNIPDIEIVHL